MLNCLKASIALGDDIPLQFNFANAIVIAMRRRSRRRRSHFPILETAGLTMSAPCSAGDCNSRGKNFPENCGTLRTKSCTLFTYSDREKIGEKKSEGAQGPGPMLFHRGHLDAAPDAGLAQGRTSDAKPASILSVPRIWQP